jgi:hypothetical protein
MWEYYVFSIDGSVELNKELNKLGEDGRELVKCGRGDSSYWFWAVLKRRKTPSN